MQRQPDWKELTYSSSYWNAVMNSLVKTSSEMLGGGGGGALTEMTKDEVFTSTGRLAVREENTIVGKVTLHYVMHDRDESISAMGQD